MATKLSSLLTTASCSRSSALRPPSTSLIAHFPSPETDCDFDSDPDAGKEMQGSYLLIQKTTPTLSSRVISTAAICALYLEEEFSMFELSEGIKKTGLCRDVKQVSENGATPPIP